MKYHIKPSNQICLYSCLFIIALSGLMPLKVLAIDTGFYSANDILFYNPDDTGCTGSSNPGSSSGSDSSSSDAGYKIRLEKVLNFFTGKGFSLASAAGIAGNLKTESGIAPTRIQGTSESVKAPDNYTLVGGVGFGIAQWTSSGRQKNLVNYAKSQSKSITDLDMQLDWIWKSSNSSFKVMVKALNSIKSDTPYKGIAAPVAAAIIFHGYTNNIISNPTIQKVNPPIGYEASGNTGEQVVTNRGGAASKIYNKYKGTIADGKGVAGVGIDTSGSSLGTGGCSDGTIAGNIVSTALSFALDKPIPPDAKPLKNQPSDAKPAYVTAIGQYNKGASVADCGMFVGTVMIASKADEKYPKSSTLTQMDYLKKTTDKYKIIDSPKKADLLPGDILIVHNDSINAHHTMIYTGNSPYPAVDASQDTRVPGVRDDTSLNWILEKSGVIAARIIK